MNRLTTRTRLVVFGLGLALATPILAQIQSQSVTFPRGASSTTINARIQGDVTRDYVVRAAAGQTMTVSMRATNASTYFNILPAGSDEALFIGSTAGNNYTGRLPRTGAYTVRVYLMRNAARRNEVTNYRLTISVVGRPGGGQRPGAGGVRPALISDINGMDSIRAIDEMTARGFRNVDSFSSGNSLYGIYFNPRTRQCVQLTNANSRVLDARDIRIHPKCR